MTRCAGPQNLDTLGLTLYSVLANTRWAANAPPDAAAAGDAGGGLDGATERRLRDLSEQLGYRKVGPSCCHVGKPTMPDLDTILKFFSSAPPLPPLRCSKLSL